MERMAPSPWCTLPTSWEKREIRTVNSCSKRSFIGATCGDNHLFYYTRVRRNRQRTNRWAGCNKRVVSDSTPGDGRIHVPSRRRGRFLLLAFREPGVSRSGSTSPAIRSFRLGSRPQRTRPRARGQRPRRCACTQPERRSTPLTKVCASRSSGASPASLVANATTSTTAFPLDLPSQGRNRLFSRRRA